MASIEVQGREVPAVGFGTWELTGDDAIEGTRHAIELGYRQIDTAQIYDNEREVGEGISRSGVDREHIFLTTKLARGSLTGDRVGPELDISLQKLGTDYVDLLLIHWPSDTVPLGETLEAMMAAQAAGKVRHLGVSNFDPALLLEAMTLAPIFANQVKYHVGRDRTELLAIAAERDLLITAYSPLLGDGVKSPVVAEIAESHGKTPHQVALRWLLQQPRVSPIPRSSNPDHRAQNLAVFDFELSDDEMARVSGLGSPAEFPAD